MSSSGARREAFDLILVGYNTRDKEGLKRLRGGYGGARQVAPGG